MIDAEAAAFIGAVPFERTPARVAQRNGTRPRTLTTTAGELELRIPKQRQGSFFPSLLERRRRVDQALFAVVMEAYVHGVSTRKVDDLVKALGADTGISKSEVSRICANLDEDVAAFGDRPLADQAYPYVFCSSTRPTARPVSGAGSSPKPWSSRSGSRRMGAVRCSGSRSGRPSRNRSGRLSSAR
ncbi:transposase-like protein [Microbacterium aurum]|nr:transposase-like protein [Microbacterium aurum]